MIFLTEVSEIEEFYRIKTLFESKGIVVHVGNQETARNFGVFHPAGKYAIHIMLKEQFDDAEQLLLDPNHIVQKPIQLSDFNEQVSKAKINQTIISSLLAILAFFILFGFLMYLFMKY